MKELSLENRATVTNHLQLALDQITTAGNVSLDTLRNLYVTLAMLDPEGKYDSNKPSCPRCGGEYTKFSGCGCGL